MRSVAVLPAIALVSGVAAGVSSPALVDLRWVIVVCWAVAVAAWVVRRSPVLLVAGVTLAGYLLCGAQLGAAATREALSPPLRQVLDAAFGGFRLGAPGSGGTHPPQWTRLVLVEDAAVRDDGVSLRGEVEWVRLDGVRHPARGGVLVSVSGAAAASHAGDWRGGRTLELPATFRRPARYLDDGVADAEREQALAGIALLGGVKSGLLVNVVARGSVFAEAAAAVRAHVRQTIARLIGLADPLGAAIVTAILIGDRTGLPVEVRERLQAAGTYHVIAISGGNIAILAAVLIGLLAGIGIRPRRRALVVIAGLAAYAVIVSSGPSVWRATVTAIAYLSARLIDHRSPPWNAVAVSAAALACATPLDVTTAGFALSFGATVALLYVTRRFAGEPGSRRPVQAWALATVRASVAVELTLLPIGAVAFFRVTAAGLALNLAALPLMTAAQIAGLAVVVCPWIDRIAGSSAWVAGLATSALTSSARLVDLLPWLSPSVPPPPSWMIAAYYVALGAAALTRGWWRRAGGILLAVLGVAIVSGWPFSVGDGPPAGVLRLTAFDVGQGDALLLQLPDGSSLMVDTGGVGVGGSTFDIGARVLAPALWARGVRRLDTLAITHGDPDHLGGAHGVIRGFSPRHLLEGVRVDHHAPSALVRTAAIGYGARISTARAGTERRIGRVRIRTLHPPEPDWLRPRVRNDDSVVLEVLYGDVAILLTGDIGADIERALIPQLTPARFRVLKVAHHGSRSSTTPEFLAAWRPQIAIISCGRGNTFGHPTPEVLDRLAAVGATVFRTDRDGQITLETDGRDVTTQTYVQSKGRE